MIFCCVYSEGDLSFHQKIFTKLQVPSSVFAMNKLDQPVHIWFNTGTEIIRGPVIHEPFLE